MDVILPNFGGKLREGARPRTNQEAKRRGRKVVGPDAYLIKSYGKGSLNFQVEALQEEVLEVDHSNADFLNALERMTFSENIDSSSLRS
jgi:hypothetical protein